MAAKPRWWEARLTQSRKPATYTCPFCRGQLPAMSRHMLLFPEGDHERRRHAHAECVMKERKAGRLLTQAEWQATQPREPRKPRRFPWRRKQVDG
jgi:hypothetical protein